MAQWVGVFLASATSLLAMDVPLDEKLISLSLKKGIEVWFKEHLSPSAQVACRFVGQDPLQGKPQIFDLDCPADVFEEELPSFLNYCEEEIQKKGGASIGLVAVGPLPQGLHHYLVNRYDHSAISNAISEEAIQLIPTTASNELDVLLSYPVTLTPVQTDNDLKKLWVFYLLQSMVESRFKQAATCSNGRWVASEDLKHLLPAQITVGHAIENLGNEQLLKSFLSTIQVLKERGFTDSELADAKARLIKHIKQFYETNPSEKMLADYYASHLAASIPCSEYSSFMTLSLHMIPEINMADLTQALSTSLKDDCRQVVIRYPEKQMLSKDQVQTVLTQFASDAIEFKHEDPTKIEIVAGTDPFSQLPITPEEQKMIQGIVQTVAESNLLKLGILRPELEGIRKQLLHIHPLRSIATMLGEPYTKKCLAEIMDSFFKWGSFISDFSKRINQEAESGNLTMYIHGFCLTVKANPDQVRAYINNKEWEKLVKYLIKLNN